MQPDIMSWPRGSNIRPVRIQSNSREEMRALLDHGRAFELGAAAGDQPHGIAAGMTVDTEEAMTRHDDLLLMAFAQAYHQARICATRWRHQFTPCIFDAFFLRQNEVPLTAAACQSRHDVAPFNFSECNSGSIETPRLSDRTLSSIASSKMGQRITNQETS